MISRYLPKRWAAHITPAVLCLMAAALSLALSAAPAHADPTFPQLTGRVVDDAHILSEEAKAQLQAALAAEEKRSGAQIVVVTLQSLQGYPIETFGYQLGRHWGIGRKGKNNGVLFIVAPNEHRMRIEVGYGLEGELTDLQAAIIMHDVVTPEFKAGHFDEGVIKGTNAILKVLVGGSIKTDLDSDDDRSVENFRLGAFFFILCGIVFIGWPAVMIFWFYTHVRELHEAHAARAIGSRTSLSSDSRTWGHDSSDDDHESSSSSSSDDDFSGGGGDFGGGGASGSW